MATSENALFFMKEAVVHHLEECDASVSSRLRWPEGSVSDQPPNFRVLTVLERSRPLPGMTRLILRGQDLASLTEDGLHVKLMLPAERGRIPTWPGMEPNGATRWPRGEDRLHVRYFTLRSVLPEEGKVVIDLVDHAGGNISDWAVQAAQGDAIGVMGPGGGLPPRDSGRPIILGGDMTALPAIARILEGPDPPAAGHLLVEFPDIIDLAAYLPAHALEVHRFEVGRFNPGATSRVLEITANGWTGDIWFGAEHATVQAIHEYFNASPLLSPRQKHIVTFWRHGKRGDARRGD